MVFVTSCVGTTVLASYLFSLVSSSQFIMYIFTMILNSCIYYFISLVKMFPLNNCRVIFLNNCIDYVIFLVKYFRGFPRAYKEELKFTCMTLNAFSSMVSTFQPQHLLCLNWPFSSEKLTYSLFPKLPSTLLQYHLFPCAIPFTGTDIIFALIF